MSNLWKKLKITQGGLEYIKNVVGVGYKFEVKDFTSLAILFYS